MTHYIPALLAVPKNRLPVPFRFLLFVGCLLSFDPPASGQQTFLALTSGKAGASGNATLPIAMLLPPVNTTIPVALQWTFTFNPAQIASLSVTQGSSLTAAGKSLTCAGSPGAYTCIGVGENTTPIQSGIIGYASVTVAPGVYSASIGITGALGADMNANAVGILTSGGVVSVPVPPGKPLPTVTQFKSLTSGFLTGSGSNPLALSSSSQVRSLVCDPVSKPGARVQCTIALEQPAFSPGATISVSSTDESVAVPNTIHVRPGHGSAGFEALVSASAKAEGVMLTVGDGSSKATAQLTIDTRNPVLNVPKDIWVRYGQPVKFTVAVSNPASLTDPLSATNLPQRSAFDPATGEFQWTPAEFEQGIHNIDFSIGDSAQGQASAHVRVYVGSGNSPVAVVNAASHSDLAVCSSGSIASLSHPPVRDPATVRVLVNGKTTELISSTPEQADFVCPPGEPGALLSVALQSSEGIGEPTQVTLLRATPAIFTVGDTSQGAIQLSGTGTLAAIPDPLSPSASPAEVGDLLSIFATGVGTSDPGRVKVYVDRTETRAISIAPVRDRQGMVEVRFQVPPGVGYSRRTPVFLAVSTVDGGVSFSNNVSIATDPLNR